STALISNASSAYSSYAVVNINKGKSPSDKAVILLAAVTPDIPGISTSKNITSGSCSSYKVVNCSPVLADGHNVMSDSRCNKYMSYFCAIISSSAIITFNFIQYLLFLLYEFEYL